MAKPVVRFLLVVAAASCAFMAGGAIRVAQDQCGPFTDVSAMYCPFVLETYYTGISAGTSPTTFSPDASITRGQAAVFAAKGLNQALARGSRRAALGQWWTTTPHYEMGLGVTTVGPNPMGVACDGADVWTANIGGDAVSRVRASDGRLLETWTGASGANAVFSAMGRIFVAARSGTADGRGGTLYVIDPSQPAGPMQLVTDTLWASPAGIGFDGTNLWVVSAGGPETPGGALAIVHPSSTYPWDYTEIKNDIQLPRGGIAFDGQNMWLVDGLNLKKRDAAGALLQSVPMGHAGESPVFDGQNIWVPSQDGHVVVVSASTGTVVADLSGNGLGIAFTAAFDGQRILVTTNETPGAVSLWRAADLAPLGSFPITGAGNRPYGACSDGINFWVTLENSPGQLARF